MVALMGTRYRYRVVWEFVLFSVAMGETTGTRYHYRLPVPVVVPVMLEALCSTVSTRVSGTGYLVPGNVLLAYRMIEVDAS